MKTTRIILSIALVALTTTLFARIDEPTEECNCCPNELELVMEKDMGLENWMSEPFEASLENDLSVENWMVAPFETSIDEELTLEEWMSTPFESSIEEGQLQIECWMADSWI